MYGSGGNGGYGMSALPSQSYHQQDASTVFLWVSNDGAEFGGMGDWNGDEGKDAGDAGGGGLLACTFGGATRGDGMGPDRHCFTLQFALNMFNTALPLRHLSSLFPHAPPGSSIWVGDSGSSVHGTGSDQFVYNKRLPRPEETYLHIGNGHKLKVEWFGSLDVVLHCKEDVPVTLEDVALIPPLTFDLMSINCIQKRYDVLMNRESAWLLNGRVHFVKSPAGNYIAATRVKHRSADPPAMVAAMMRPGPQRSMNWDDLHFSLGHTNDDNARETAKQRGIKVTGVRGYCDGCGESKAIRRAVPKETTLKAERPMKRVFVDLAGPFMTSAGGARYCMLMVVDYTNVGWTLFLGDKSGDTLCQAFRSWHTAVKSTAAIHGGLEIARFDNGNEFTNADFRKLLTELGVAVEYTPVDGAKRNGRVERKLALIGEGARAAWLEFPRHFPDLEFPAKANSWHQIWHEAFTWMNNCLNTTAQAHTPDKLSPYERLYKKRPTNRLLPFMMPGFRHHNRKNKAESKGERCFFLNSVNNHSSTTDKILLPSGIASYSADVTWRYRRRPFVGELPTWGGGAVVDLSVEPAVAGSIGGRVFPAASAGMMAGATAAAGTRGAMTSAPAVAGSTGGSVFPAASVGMMAGAPAAAGTRGAATSAPAVAGSIGGSVFPAASAGMMAGAPAAAGTRGAATSAPAVAGSTGGSVFPAASAGMMAGAPAAAGTRGAATSVPAVAGSIVGSVFPAASAGMMAGATAAAETRGAVTSAPAVAGSTGGSVFPAASAGMMAGAPAAAGTRGAATSAPAVAGSTGGSVFPVASAGMMAGATAAAGTRGVATSAPAVAGSIGGSVFPAASAGMMAGAPAVAGTGGAATSAPAVAGSIGGSVFPAASAGIMAGAPAAAGTRGKATSASAVAGSIGGSVFPAASAGMMAGAPAAAGTRGAATSASAVAGSNGGSVFPAASAGIMAGAPAAAGTRGKATSASAVAGSIGGSVFPAASARMMAGAPATTGSRGAMASAPAVAGGFGGNVFSAESARMMAGAPAAAGSRGAAPVVASGSGGNVFPAESAGMMAGTPAAAGWSGAAFQAASSAVRPPPAVAFASDDHEGCQVRRTATATHRQSYEVTPAMTRSGSQSSARQDGVSGAFAAGTMGEETVGTLDEDDGELPAGPAHLLMTPETYAQAHAVPHSRIWMEAESKEFEGLLAVGTFVEEGGI